MSRGVSHDLCMRDEQLWSLVNFMMAPGRDIDNWRYIRRCGWYYDNENVTLYRGIKCNLADVGYDSIRCSSWTRSKMVAETMGNVILECVFPSSFFVFDTRFCINGFFACYKWQKEIIIRPYRACMCNIVAYENNKKEEPMVLQEIFE